MKHTTRLPACLTVRTLAERMDVSEKTVRRWIASGQLPHHRLGRAVRVSEDDAMKFVAAGRR